MATSGRPMAKRANTTSTRSQPEPGVRGRTAVFPVGKTVHVSGQAQARIVDSDIARQFDFPTHGQSDLPQRPSTSGGPASKTNLSAPKHFDKRETRDDLHLNPLAAHGKETTFYDFPLPGPLPKSATSSGSLSPTPFPLRKSSLAGSIRSETPDSPAGEIVNMESQLGIGMALGSPSHPPPQAQQPAVWNQHVRFDTPRVASPEEMSPMDNWSDAAVAPPKQKASKWKILGGFFGGGKKTGGPSPQQFYQVQPESGVQTTVEADFVSSPSNTAEKPRGRGRTNSERKTNKHKPDMKRANTAPSDSPMAFNFATERNAQMAGTPKITLDGGPMLNVDIPSVQMERYSVMFGSVLKPNAASSSALLARRQATLDKLKTVNEALQEKERELEEKERLLRPRRATSPQPTKSPAFSLFPNTPQRLTSRDPSPSEPRHRSPLHRSNTAPGALSPARSTFEDLPEPKKESKPKPVLHQAPPIAPPHHADGRPKPKHQPIVTQFSQEESHLDLTSPNGSILSYENDVYDPTPFPMKPKLYSPAWEMVTNHPTAGAGSTSSGSTLNSASSANTSVSSPLDTLVAPSRHRAGTVTNSTISTTSMDVPIAFAPPPLRERTNTTSKLKPIISAAEIAALSQQPLKGSVAATSIPKSVSNNTRPNNNISITKSSTPITRPQARSQISHQKEVSSGAFSFEESRISEDEQQRLKTAADVSIARQISVSRQQRQLLIPIKKSSASPSPTNQSPVDKPRIKVKTELTGLGERLVDSPVRALTPTLVVVGGGPPDSRVRGMQVRKGSAIGAAHLGVVSNGNMELQHRKSERGVVERV